YASAGAAVYSRPSVPRASRRSDVVARSADTSHFLHALRAGLGKRFGKHGMASGKHGLIRLSDSKSSHPPPGSARSACQNETVAAERSGVPGERPTRGRGERPEEGNAAPVRAEGHRPCPVAAHPGVQGETG